MKKIPSMKIIEVDKAVAKKFLACNIKNRTLNRYRIKKYADQMSTGKWKMNGEPVIIGLNGVVLDGQHRLSAIYENDLKIKLIFLFNIDPNTFDTIDTGDSRSGADVLTITGMKKKTAENLSVCVRTDIIMKHTGSISSQTRMQSKITPQAVLRAVENEPGYLDAVKFIEKFGKRNLQMPASALSFMAYRFFKIDKQFSEGWLSCLISGVGIIEENDPRTWIRNMLWRDINRNQKRPLRHKIGIVIRAWYIARMGRQIKHEGNLNRDPMDAFKYIVLEDDLAGM